MTPLVLTGMHRSGTSAAARLVQKLGINLGSNLLPATINNRHGHFEDRAFIDFHDLLIARDFSDLAPFCEWLPLQESPAATQSGDVESARQIWAAHQVAGGSGWKDPRTSLFLDLWAEALPGLKIIVCVRHPYQVHLSLLRRGEPFLHADYSAALRGWQIYNCRILRALAALPAGRFEVIDVESAFRDPQQLGRRLAQFLEVASPDSSFGAITVEDFHFHDDLTTSLQSFSAFFPEADATYRKLRRLDSCVRELAEATTVPTPESGSDETRLIAFEERHGLRAMTRQMLVASIQAVRRRCLDFSRLSALEQAEKDKLIEDLSRLNEKLKRELVRQKTPGN